MQGERSMFHQIIIPPLSVILLVPSSRETVHSRSPEALQEGTLLLRRLGRCAPPVHWQKAAKLYLLLCRYSISWDIWAMPSSVKGAPNTNPFSRKENRIYEHIDAPAGRTRIMQKPFHTMLRRLNYKLWASTCLPSHFASAPSHSSFTSSLGFRFHFLQEIIL